jgi:hypothetical protein
MILPLRGCTGFAHAAPNEGNETPAGQRKPGSDPGPVDPAASSRFLVAAGQPEPRSTSLKGSGTLPDLILQKIEIMNTCIMNFEDIQCVEDLETVSEETIWQNFERLAGFIFEKNDFRVSINTVKTYNKTKRQYDVISKKSNQTFLVECKKWAGNRYRLSALKKAIDQHKERTLFYEHITHEDAIPLVVTLIEEEILVYEGLPIVPILKLNSFINELDDRTDANPFGDEDDLPFT